VFSSRRNESTDDVEPKSSVFQLLAAARLSTVDTLKDGTTRWFVAADLSVRRHETLTTWRVVRDSSAQLHEELRNFSKSLTETDDRTLPNNEVTFKLRKLCKITNIHVLVSSADVDSLLYLCCEQGQSISLTAFSNRKTIFCLLKLRIASYRVASHVRLIHVDKTQQYYLVHVNKRKIARIK